MTHGTIQHHFNSLDEVLEEALNYALEVTLPTITEVQDGSDLYGHLVDVIREKPDVQAFQMEMVLESRHRPRLAAYVKHIYRIYHHCTEASLALLGLADDEELTQLALAVGDGIIFQFIAMGPEHAPNAEAQIRGLSRLISTYAKSQIRD